MLLSNIRYEGVSPLEDCVSNDDYYCRICQLSSRKNMGCYVLQQHTSVLSSGECWCQVVSGMILIQTSCVEDLHPLFMR